MGAIRNFGMGVIDDRIRRLIREEVKSAIRAVSGGGYSISPTIGGVVQHGHDSAAHTGLTTDNHHAEVHAIDGTDHTFPEGDGSTYLNDQGDFATPAGTGTPTLAEVLAEGNLVGGEVISGDPVGGFAGEVVLDDTQARLRYVDGGGEAGVFAASTQAFLTIVGGAAVAVTADGVKIKDSAASFGDADQVLTAVGDDTAIWADSTGGGGGLTNLDGGDADSTYGATTPIDGGGA